MSKKKETQEKSTPLISYETLIPARFKEHFRSNYEDNIKKLIKWNRIGILSYKAMVIGLLGSAILVGIWSTYLGMSLEIRRYVGMIFFLVILVPMVSIFFSSWKAESLKVKDKNKLVYYLLEAGKHYDGFAFAEEKDKEVFRVKCLLAMAEFSKHFKLILEQPRMPLKLPGIAQLEALHENVMSRIYPAIRNSQEYLEIPEERSFSNVLVALAALFFSEKNYGELPLINQKISKEFNDVYEHYSPEKKERARSFLKFISRSSKLLVVLSLPAISALALFITYLLRVPIYGIEDFWHYVGENAAIISLGILAAWASVILALYTLRSER